MRLRFSLVAVLLGVAACGPAQGRFPFPVCVKTVASDVDVPTQQAADILIVVDNSGSMQEEQQNLKDNFLNPNAAECPLQDLKNIPEQFKNPSVDLYTGDGPLAKCGFVQLVAAFDNDFRIGVITTDVALCDNELNIAPAGWGFHPQRGCLQPDGAPGGASLHKVIARADLEDDDPQNDDLAARFGATLDNIGTFGSPFERGLDAMDLFLDPDADREPDCAGDLDLFRRPNASLVVIFLSDEEDCSHDLGGALDRFGNELAGNTVCGEFRDLVTNDFQPDRCYSDIAELSPVDLYVDSLRARDPNAKVAVIAGSVDGPDGSSIPEGCLVDTNGLPTGGADVCFSSEGLSNFDAPGEPCGPDTAADRNNLPCCVADGGGRYYDFADKVGRKATDSICNSSFRGTMLNIAAFIAAVDVVNLAEAPDSPNAILVELTRAGSDKAEVLPPLDDPSLCDTTTGFLLENDTQLRLCGDARAGPGDKLAVRARGADITEASCAKPFFEASGGAVNCASSSPSPAVAALVAALAAAGLARRRSRARARGAA